MSEKAEIFVKDWISENVHNDPSVDGDRYDRHVVGLWQHLVIAASREGIALPEIEESLGDLQDLLGEAFGSVFDPTVGGIKD